MRFGLREWSSCVFTHGHTSDSMCGGKKIKKPNLQYFTGLSLSESIFFWQERLNSWTRCKEFGFANRAPAEERISVLLFNSIKSHHLCLIVCCCAPAKKATKVTNGKWKPGWGFKLVYSKTHVHHFPLHVSVSARQINVVHYSLIAFQTLHPSTVSVKQTCQYLQDVGKSNNDITFSVTVNSSHYPTIPLEVQDWLFH